MLLKVPIELVIEGAEQPRLPGYPWTLIDLLQGDHGELAALLLDELDLPRFIELGFSGS